LYACPYPDCGHKVTRRDNLHDCVLSVLLPFPSALLLPPPATIAAGLDVTHFSSGVCQSEGDITTVLGEQELQQGPEQTFVNELKAEYSQPISHFDILLSPRCCSRWVAGGGRTPVVADRGCVDIVHRLPPQFPAPAPLQAAARNHRLAAIGCCQAAIGCYGGALPPSVSGGGMSNRVLMNITQDALKVWPVAFMCASRFAAGRLEHHEQYSWATSKD